MHGFIVAFGCFLCGEFGRLLMALGVGESREFWAIALICSVWKSSFVALGAAMHLHRALRRPLPGLAG